MPKATPHNPIQTAVKPWLLEQHIFSEAEAEPRIKALLSSAPKRFVIYEPMALLPSGSFSKPVWIDVLQTCSTESRTALWRLLLKELSLVAKSPLTNLAINEGIPLEKDGDSGEENILRSPTGLRMLYGDFGPALNEAETVGASAFETALWVSTKQNGIHQTWAPRWTMFSRGNVTEKARLLEFKHTTSPSGEQPWAIDLYAGIGYFVFSYAKMGMRVLCWEINPWSVEGLRRGACANKWSVKIVSEPADLALSAEEILDSGEQIIVFQEDNQLALERMTRLHQIGIATQIAHINGGFLPTSEPTWGPAWNMAQHSIAAKTWLHLHENVGVHDISSRRAEIEQRFQQWNQVKPNSWQVTVSHVEQVKTFAPGVWHCVFDVCITRPQI